MNFIFKTENDFTVLKEEIRQGLIIEKKIKVEKHGSVPAAVLMLLLNKNNEAYVFLTKRTQKVRSHKGQVSFPGGAREKSDKSFLDTALRETYEETGIKPGDVEIIGEFDEMISVTDFHVHSFIGSIKYPYKYKINKDEIEECFEPLFQFFIIKNIIKQKTIFLTENTERSIIIYITDLKYGV